MELVATASDQSEFVLRISRREAELLTFGVDVIAAPFSSLEKMLGETFVQRLEESGFQQTDLRDLWCGWYQEILSSR